MSKEKIINKLLKYFYGIDGVLDEYKKSQLNKFGNIGFIILCWYLLISSFIALILYAQNLQTAFNFLIIGNMVIFFAAMLLSSLFLRQKKLTIVDADKTDYPKMKKKYAIKSIILGVYFGVVMLFLDALNNLVTGNGNFLTALTSLSNIGLTAVEGLSFGFIMYLLFRSRLKK